MRSGLVQYHESLDPLMVDIDSVIQNPLNYNNGDVDAIIESIEQVGMYRPIIVARDSNEIVAGNHTWMACKSLEATVIPVVWFDGESDAQVKALIGDNHIAGLARTDDAILLDLLNDLESKDELIGTGYESPDLERMRKIADMPLDTAGMDRVIEKSGWPTLFITVPPATLQGFHMLTEDVSGGDRERLEAIMRAAGWEE